MAWLVKVLSPIWKYLVSWASNRLFNLVVEIWNEYQAKLKRDKEIKKVEQEYISTVNNPDIKDEERAKVQEDAFKKLRDSLNSISK